MSTRNPVTVFRTGDSSPVFAFRESSACLTIQPILLWCSTRKRGFASSVLSAGGNPRFYLTCRRKQNRANEF
jgi:hypothetical protein